MNRFLFKLGLFVCIWYEIAAEFGLTGDAALVLGIGAWFGCRFAVRIAAHALGLLGPTVFGLAVQGAFWLALFWWWSPPFARSEPVTVIVVMLGLLMLGGGALRRFFDREVARHGRNVWRAHSTAVVITVLVALAVCMLTVMGLHSIWALAGYGLLLGLPLRIGWRLVPRLVAPRADARMGSAEGFRKAGFSEER